MWVTSLNRRLKRKGCHQGYRVSAAVKVNTDRLEDKFIKKEFSRNKFTFNVNPRLKVSMDASSI